jgi:hypothetical protein
MEQFVEREEGIEASEYGGGTALLQLMSAELVYAVLSRVDALTLAKASCVSPEFRTLCADEGLWEKLCTARWPSTKEPHVKSIVSSMVSSSTELSNFETNSGLQCSPGSQFLLEVVKLVYLQPIDGVLLQGGFRKLYAACYPLILTKGAETSKDEKIMRTWSCKAEHSHDSTGWDNCGGVQLDDDASSEEVAASDFISIIDVVYNGDSVLTRTIEGIPETGNFVADWFSVCPFSFDVLRDHRDSERDYYGFSLEEDDEGFQNSVVATNMMSRADYFPVRCTTVQQMKEERFTNDPAALKKAWKTLQENMRMSWILMRKSTKQMINLASWKPLEGGTCGWPYEEDFVLQFGSILPATTSYSSNGSTGPSKSSSNIKTASSHSIQCNIILKCNLRTAARNIPESCSVPEDPIFLKTTLWMTELSMQLKNMEGAILNGRNSLITLSRLGSITRDLKTRDHCKLVESYQACLRIKSELKKNKIRAEAQLDTAMAISAICIFFCLNFIFFYLKYY